MSEKPPPPPPPWHHTKAADSGFGHLLESILHRWRIVNTNVGLFSHTTTVNMQFQFESNIILRYNQYERLQLTWRLRPYLALSTLSCSQQISLIMIKPLQRSLFNWNSATCISVSSLTLLTWLHGRLYRLVIVAHGSPYPVQHLQVRGKWLRMGGWWVLVSSHVAVLLQKSYARRPISYISI